MNTQTKHNGVCAFGEEGNKALSHLLKFVSERKTLRNGELKHFLNSTILSGIEKILEKPANPEISEVPFPDICHLSYLLWQLVEATGGTAKSQLWQVIKASAQVISRMNPAKRENLGLSRAPAVPLTEDLLATCLEKACGVYQLPQEERKAGYWRLPGALEEPHKRLELVIILQHAAESYIEIIDQSAA